MKLLALDASTHACSVALQNDDVLITRYREAPRLQAELILPMVEEVLGESALNLSDLDFLAFGRGPGAFTGLRIAAGVIQSFSLAHQLPAYSISCLEALAYRTHKETGCSHIIVAQDARMEEIYAAAYYFHDGIVDVLLDEQVIAPDELKMPQSNGKKDNWCAAGTGWSVYAGQFSQALHDKIEIIQSDMLPRASEMIELALKQHRAGVGGVPAEEVELIYLRDKVTHD